MYPTFKNQRSITTSLYFEFDLRSNRENLKTGMNEIYEPPGTSHSRDSRVEWMMMMIVIETMIYGRGRVNFIHGDERERHSERRGGSGMGYEKHSTGSEGKQMGTASSVKGRGFLDTDPLYSSSNSSLLSLVMFSDFLIPRPW